MTAFTTFLWFDNQAEEAAQFYTSIFKDSEISSVQRYTSAGPGPEGQAMLVEFTLNGQPFNALNGGPQYTFNPSISFVVACADQAEVDHYWDALLADGGLPNACGWLNDKYGLSWQVVPTRFFEMIRDGSKAAQVTAAMLKMTKFDIATLEEAYARALLPLLLPLLRPALVMPGSCSVPGPSAARPAVRHSPRTRWGPGGPRVRLP
jgi:predicted 3-demethylubiquinone-9 3-methyltransferase (glyoxalase superfamily)